jgi:hypothetical protein
MTKEPVPVQPQEPQVEPVFEDVAANRQSFGEFERSCVGAMDLARINEAELAETRVGRLRYLAGAVATAGALLNFSDSNTVDVVGTALFSSGMGGTAALSVATGLARSRVRGLFRERASNYDGWRAARLTDEAATAEKAQ